MPKPFEWKALVQRLQYEFDKTMSAGLIALIWWLGAASLVVIVITGVIIAVTHVAPTGLPAEDFFEATWQALMRTIDAGNVYNDNGWPYRLIMLVVTFFGVFIVSSLIGLLSAIVQDRIAELRKGRSFVLERNHVVILNWSPSIFDIIRQLCLAHAGEAKFRVVIMADKDKVEMEDEIAEKLKLPRNTQVICRSGDPTDLSDLAIVNLADAASVIIVSQLDGYPDARNIKTILALTHGPHRPDKPLRITAEFRNSANVAVVRAVSGEYVQPVMADDLISRIIVHSSRQSGLSAVYADLLDFEGNEFYTLPQPSIFGLSFAKALLAFESGALIGVRGVDGRLRINPPMSQVIEDGAEAILIAEDRKSVLLADAAEVMIDADVILPTKPVVHRIERTLILGWNRRGAVIASELSNYMAEGSQITIAAHGEGVAESVGALEVENPKVKVNFVDADTSSRAALDKLDAPSYNHVIVLAYSDFMDPHPADTHTLVTLLHLRHIVEQVKCKLTVVSEMADVRNRQLAQATRVDDFVVSNKLVSLMLAQTAENEHLSEIFADILDEEGSELYMRAVTDYVKLDRPVNFYTVVAAASARGEIAVGWCRRPPGAQLTLKLNPRKSELITFEATDSIVVLAPS